LESINRLLEVGPLPIELTKLLEQACALGLRRTAQVDQNDVLAEARSLAAKLAARSRSSASDGAALDSASANALVAALLSDLTAFPEWASPPAFIYIANSAANLRDIAHAQRRFSDALDLAIVALELARTYKALTGAQAAESAIYSIAARAAEDAGTVAALERTMPHKLLDAFDRNVTIPYTPLMSGGDLSGPRAFAVAFMLRTAAQYPRTEEERQYLSELLVQVESLASRIRPKAPGAAESFDKMIAQETERAAVWLNKPGVRSFRW
jgi:hypothetical protein